MGTWVGLIHSQNVGCRFTPNKQLTQIVEPGTPGYGLGLGEAGVPDSGDDGGEDEGHDEAAQDPQVDVPQERQVHRLHVGWDGYFYRNSQSCE